MISRKIYSGISKIEICLKCGNKYLTSSTNKICSNCLGNNYIASKNTIHKIKTFKREKLRI